MATITVTSLTSVVSSSSSPTSSIGSGNGANSPNNAFFTPSGSPPLILAFLAIGLFAAAMIAVFGYRRIHWGRPWSVEGDVDVVERAPRRRRENFGERPKLWDVWVVPRMEVAAKDAGGRRYRWADMLVRVFLPPSIHILYTSIFIFSPALIGEYDHSEEQRGGSHCAKIVERLC
jgi:hypothetical protein